MLLIDDDQPELGKRQKQRRAGADDDPRPTGSDRPPGVAALGCADVGVPLRGQCAKALAEALEPLRPKGDLGQQHQHLPPGGERRGERGEIGLGLAGAGDAVEHGHPETAGCDGRRPAAARRPTGRARVGDPHSRQSGGEGRAVRPVRGAPRRGRWRPGARTTPGPHPATRASSAAASRRPVAQRLEHSLPRLGQMFCRRRAGIAPRAQPEREHRAGAAAAPRRACCDAHRHAQHRAGRRHRVGGDAFDKAAQLWLQARDG